jgi:fluoride exporter
MTFWLTNILLVALGGGIGGAARFWVSGLVASRYGETFPWGTMVVNVSGAASIGVVGALLLPPSIAAVETAPLWAGLVVGMLGSYTTVSSFSWQTLALLRSGEPLRAAFNIVGSAVLCLSGAAASYASTLAFAGSL